MSAFLLGNTAADVRAITHQHRDTTHFYRIRDPYPERAISRMMRLFPELSKPDMLTEDHAAFISGYLVHLLFDEIWTAEIFEPYYRQAEHWKDRLEYHIHHNALRVRLDREAQHSLESDFGDVCQVGTAEPQHWLPFVEDSSLAQWQDWLYQQWCQHAGVQTLNVFAERMGVPVESISNLVNEMDAGTYTAVPDLDGVIASYHAHALQESCEALAYYWHVTEAVAFAQP